MLINLRGNLSDYHNMAYGLVFKTGVLPKQGSALLLVQELMTGFAEQHKSLRVQVLVISHILVMNVKILYP